MGSREKIPIGEGVSIEPYSCEHGIAGYWVYFDDAPDDLGTVRICTLCPNPRNVPIWDVMQMEPLTLSPSIQCVGHERHHGHIREGKWVPV